MEKNTREVALKILIEINKKGAYSNIALNKHMASNINKLDENFTREIVYGVLENRLYLDWIISKVSKIKIKKIDPIILEILRIGVYQIVFMEKVPNSAAVNESVKLAKKYSHKGSVSYVNGVLRNIIRKRANILDIDIKNTIDYISIK
ncbi:transcription antitermination factor NusB, partial [Anaerosalibacter bizertensis]|nr:transcription antitermination factor NusB [Anaerosalibacter bizertensis]